MKVIYVSLITIDKVTLIISFFSLLMAGDVIYMMAFTRSGVFASNNFSGLL